MNSIVSPTSKKIPSLKPLNMSNAFQIKFSLSPLNNPNTNNNIITTKKTIAFLETLNSIKSPSHSLLKKSPKSLVNGGISSNPYKSNLPRISFKKISTNLELIKKEISHNVSLKKTVQKITPFEFNELEKNEKNEELQKKLQYKLNMVSTNHPQKQKKAKINLSKKSAALFSINQLISFKEIMTDEAGMNMIFQDNMRNFRQKSCY